MTPVVFAVFTDQIAISSGDANVKYVAENKCILDQNARALIIPPVITLLNCALKGHCHDKAHVRS